MSKFNTVDTQDILDQVETLDSKVVKIINIVKTLETRIVRLETIARNHGITLKNNKLKKEDNDESCVVM